MKTTSLLGSVFALAILALLTITAVFAAELALVHARANAAPATGENAPAETARVLEGDEFATHVFVIGRGSPFELTLDKPRNSNPGLTPAETTGAVPEAFAPVGAEASMVQSNYGSRPMVELSLALP